MHHVTRQVEYRGELVSLTEALVGFPAGGQVLLSGATYQRLYGRLHNVNLKSSSLRGLKLLSLKQPGTAWLQTAWDPYQRLHGRLHFVNLKSSSLRGLKLPSLKQPGTAGLQTAWDLYQRLHGQLHFVNLTSSSLRGLKMQGTAWS